MMNKPARCIYLFSILYSVLTEQVNLAPLRLFNVLNLSELQQSYGRNRSEFSRPS